MSFTFYSEEDMQITERAKQLQQLIARLKASSSLDGSSMRLRSSPVVKVVRGKKLKAGETIVESWKWLVNVFLVIVINNAVLLLVMWTIV